MRSTKIRPTKLLLAFVLNLMAMPAAAQPIQTGPGWNVGRAVLHQPGRAGCLKNLAL